MCKIIVKEMGEFVEEGANIHIENVAHNLY
jgi:hypothetical protein